MLITLLISCALLSSPAPDAVAENITADQPKAICRPHLPVAGTLPVTTAVPAPESVCANYKKIMVFCRSDAVSVSVFFNVAPPFARIRSPTQFFTQRNSGHYATTRVRLITEHSILIRSPTFA